jgi:hypothetical protein
MRFSQRFGITSVRSALQGRSLDEATRNRLWSAFARAVPEAQGPLNRTWMRTVYEEIWMEHFKEPVDHMPVLERDIRGQLRHIFLQGEWYEVYDLSEFLINCRESANIYKFPEEVARILAEEHAGFRLVNGMFVEITDESELDAIEEGLQHTATDQFSPARAHLMTALNLLSDRRSPDYRNSIKESISAVEAVVQILTGDPQAELGKGLKLLRSNPPVHGALRSAFTSLYGYTSDADGIRHALTEEATVDAADAKFMLVACSAFVVYLIQKVALPAGER